MSFYKLQLMNGTSMAAPHVCGAVALLMSGLKQRDILFTPFSIKRGLSVSAKHLPDVCHYGQGHGLLQVEKAFEHLVANGKEVDNRVRFAVTCHAGSNGSKGIHLRDISSVDKPMEVPVKVEPVFLNPDEVAAEDKIDFNLRFGLTCDAGWITHPKHLDLMYTARHFLINVDPSGLKSGVHSAYVKAYEAGDPDKGPLFEIPITVVKPEPITEIPRPRIAHDNVVFTPGMIKRHFVKVPKGATWATVTVQSNETKAVGKFALHTVQLIPKKVVRTFENHKMFTLNEVGEWSFSFAVRGGFVLEVLLAKWWANIGNLDVSYNVTFYGLNPEAKEIVFHGADAIVRVDVTSDLHLEEAQPEAKLKHLVQNFRPVESKVIALGERDIIPPHRTIFELQSSYNFNVAKGTEITPNVAILSDVLYESEFISQLWMLYNSRKQLIGYGDAYANKYSLKVTWIEFQIGLYLT